MYQIQFKDYSVWQDFTATIDEKAGCYENEKEAENAIDAAKVCYPVTEKEEGIYNDFLIFNQCSTFFPGGLYVTY